MRLEPITEYAHGTFFYDKTREYVLVQVLNTTEPALDGEYRESPNVSLHVDGRRLKVTGARTVWPKEEELAVRSRNGSAEVQLPKPARYTALISNWRRREGVASGPRRAFCQRKKWSYEHAVLRRFGYRAV